jgi:pyruvate/2-oxoglutarate dehydrogenase complex dihydrolipoamide dehydrogenase (E3) component
MEHMSPQQYDVIVIGAGQSGGALSTAFAGAGRKTALIEREHVGGTCVNEGCTPTKTMVASARVAHLARRGADYGVQTGPVSVDMGTVRQRKRDIVESFRNGSRQRIVSTEGVDLIDGEARFTGPKTLEVRLNAGGTQELAADLIIINTGGRPVNPPVAGLDTVPTLNSTTIMELDAVPAHLLVLGGGYIGLEFGQMFRRFGSAVTIVQRGGQLLAREDADVAEEVATIMREDGIEVLLNTQAERVEQSSDGSIQMTVSSAEGKRTLNSSHLLVAAGRTPNTDMLSLEAAGIETTKRGHVVVNERLETSVPGIYALGDVNGGPAFTHISYDDYRIAETDQILGCAILGIEGSEIMSALQIAMMGRLPYTALRDGIFAHPTLMESLNNLFSLVE